MPMIINPHFLVAVPGANARLLLFFSMVVVINIGANADALLNPSRKIFPDVELGQPAVAATATGAGVGAGPGSAGAGVNCTVMASGCGIGGSGSVSAAGGCRAGDACSGTGGCGCGGVSVVAHSR